jgi:hypothetical protein
MEGKITYRRRKRSLDICITHMISVKKLNHQRTTAMNSFLRIFTRVITILAAAVVIPIVTLLLWWADWTTKNRRDEI